MSDAVAEDDGRQACRDPLDPAHEHLGIDAVDVHPRPVHVEVAERHVVEARGGPKAAEHPFTEGLGHAVCRVVVVRVVPLAGRELLGHAVHRGGGGRHDLANPGGNRGVDHLERAAGEHLERESRVLGALRDPHRRLVEHDIGALHQPVEQGAVADIADHQLHPSRTRCLVEVRLPAAREVVERHNGGIGLLDERDPRCASRRGPHRR